MHDRPHRGRVAPPSKAPQRSSALTAVGGARAHRVIDFIRRAGSMTPMLLTAWLVVHNGPIEPERASLLMVLVHCTEHANSSGKRPHKR